MVDQEYLTQQEFKGRKELCDERFRRDNTRLRDTEEKLDKVATNLSQITEIIKRNTEGQEDHEKRLRAIELKGGQWFDKIITIALTVAITALLTLLLTGKL